MKKKGIKIGFLGYCYLYTRQCSTVRKLYKAGAPFYSDVVAQQDVGQLKVIYCHFQVNFQNKVLKFLKNVPTDMILRDGILEMRKITTLQV